MKSFRGVALKNRKKTPKKRLQKNFQHKIPLPPNIDQKQLSPQVKARRMAYAEHKPLPGAGAPAFDILTQTATLKGMPGADPLMPMYMLDKDYRILDWNDAFTLAFDRTMEGRRGMSVLEWVYFLDNFRDVLDHGIKAFSDPNALPLIDVEPIGYTSQRYGKIDATKRAYQIPDDTGHCAGWVVTLDPCFRDASQANRYFLELIQLLQSRLMWSEYAMSYDIVLNNTQVYRDLIETIAGENEILEKIAPNTKVLDLGAGTGNITEILANSAYGRLIFALDNSRTMLNILVDKCRPYIRQDDQGSGVIAIKQDITSLFGLKDDYFHYTIMNNSLYTLSDPISCLQEVHRVLIPGGEIRISGPKKTTDLDSLFRRIKSDLQKTGKYEALQEYYEHVRRINEHNLSPLLYRLTVHDVVEMLSQVGFSQITYSTEKAYAGQAMIVCARK